MCRPRNMRTRVQRQVHFVPTLTYKRHAHLVNCSRDPGCWCWCLSGWERTDEEEGAGEKDGQGVRGKGTVKRLEGREGAEW